MSMRSLEQIIHDNLMPHPETGEAADRDNPRAVMRFRHDLSRAIVGEFFDASIGPMDHDIVIR